MVIGEVEGEIRRKRRGRRWARCGERRRRRGGRLGRGRRLRGWPAPGRGRGWGLGPIDRGRRRVEPAPLREGDRRGQRRRRYDDVYVWMDGCTHDVAVGHVRGVGVVRPRRGGRIHPDASGAVRRVGRHRGGHVTRLRCRIEMDTPCLLGITRVRASCGRSSALTSHRAACRSRASCAMAETALPR